MAEPILVLDHVTKRFGDFVAVQGFSASIARGEFVVILGPSGCGKTTTLNMVAGLENVTEGKIFLKGECVNDVPAYRRDVRTVFQQFALFPHMTVRRNVEFGLKMRGLPKLERGRRAVEMLELVGLRELVDRRPESLSGGQQQRVALARALITEPQVLLLDEPIGNLDANLRAGMMEELRHLQRSLGITFVMVTHSQEEALPMADRLVVMSDAVIQQIGPPDEVFGKPRTRFVASFIGKNNIFDGVLRSGEDDVGEVETGEGVFRVPLCGSPFSGGKRVSFSVRSDLCSIAMGSGFDCQVVGVLRGIDYRGSLVTYVVELKTGNLLRVQVHESVYHKYRYNPGERLTACWRSRDGVLHSS